MKTCRFQCCAGALLASLLGMVMLVNGCGKPPGGEFADVRAGLLVQTAPAGARPISEINTGREAGDLKVGSEVVVRARINAGEMTPWTQDQAAFIVTDATGHDGSEEHDPHQCPFCRRDIRDHIALVRCTGDDGQLVPMDARQLLGVAKGELLVVQGTIADIEAEELAINAQQIHVVPPK